MANVVNLTEEMLEVWAGRNPAPIHWLPLVGGEGLRVAPADCGIRGPFRRIDTGRDQGRRYCPGCADEGGADA